LSVFGDDVASSALNLARSLWAELGVGDAPRRHDWQALDLEPLIIFTACALSDGGLRAKVIDWCIANIPYLSSVRLHHFCRQAGPHARLAAVRYVGAIESGAKGRPRVTLTPDLRRPSLIQLRLRALTGVSARAEILKALIASPQHPRTASSLVAGAGYGKTDLAHALDLLTLAGITVVEPSANKLVYKLSRPAELTQALNGVPAGFPDWWAIFKVTEAILRYARGASSEPEQRVAAAQGLVRELKEEFQRLPGQSRPPLLTGPESIGAFDQWARSFMADQAAADGTVDQARAVVYTVHRLLVGGWIATVTEIGDHPRPLALSDDPELRHDRRAHRRLRDDEIGAAADVIESMLTDMRMRDLERSQGSLVRRQSVSDTLRPAMSHEFASELLQPMRKGQSATFTQEFLQRWFANRRHRLTEAG
jgi:hypothetical protein